MVRIQVIGSLAREGAEAGKRRVQRREQARRKNDVADESAGTARTRDEDGEREQQWTVGGERGGGGEERERREQPEARESAITRPAAPPPKQPPPPSPPAPPSVLSSSPWLLGPGSPDWGQSAAKAWGRCRDGTCWDQEREAMLARYASLVLTHLLGMEKVLETVMDSVNSPDSSMAALFSVASAAISTSRGVLGVFGPPRSTSA